jgi:outer membrane protein assembly factor BamB
LEEKMPDVDQLFRAMQSDADLVPSPDVSMIQAAGRRRRRRHTARAMVAVGLVVAAVSMVPALWPKATRPPTDTAPTGVTFTPLRAIGSEEVTFGALTPGPLRSVTTAIVDGRGYVLWEEATGVPRVAALDVATGHKLWGPVTLSRTDGWAAIYATSRAVVVGTGSEGSDATVVVLDPDTGQERWRRQLGTVVGAAYDSAIVLANQATGVTEALDLQTGETLWTVTDPSGSVATVLGMRVSEDMSQTGPYLGYSDHRLVEVGGDQTVRVYDVLSGQLLGSRPALGNEALAYDGTVYAIRDSTATTPNQVLAYPAIGTEPARTVYQSPQGSPRLRALAPCGAHRICLVEGYGTNNGADADVVAVDVDARASVWRTRTGDLDGLFPLGGGRVLGRAENGLAGIYGDDRSVVLLPRGSNGRVDRVDAGSVLMLRPADGQPQQAAGDTYVVGVSVTTGEQIALGRIPIWPVSCSWDTRYLLCATGTGFQVWRFTAD